MSSDNVYLSRKEQVFLMEMLEVKDPIEAVEKFAELMILEKADPTELSKYLKKIMNNMEKK